MTRPRDRALIVAVLALVAGVAFLRTGPVTSPPATGRPRMVDLGAGRCIPCRQMTPILAELRDHYAGRADVVFVDVWEDPGQADAYTFRAIPTQIFYDRGGRETWRHEGFLGREEIMARFAGMGVE